MNQDQRKEELNITQKSGKQDQLWVFSEASVKSNQISVCYFTQDLHSKKWMYGWPIWIKKKTPTWFSTRGSWINITESYRDYVQSRKGNSPTQSWDGIVEEGWIDSEQVKTDVLSRWAEESYKGFETM